jgi:hypothetical protein
VTSVLRRMFELIDGPEPERCRELLADDLRFSIVFSDGPGRARDFAGGRAAFDAYLEQRDAPPWTHHVLSQSSNGAVELALGETRVDGAPLATFVAAARVDGSGLVDRYVVGRSPNVLFDASAPGSP